MESSFPLYQLNKEAITMLNGGRYDAASGLFDQILRAHEQQEDREGRFPIPTIRPVQLNVPTHGHDNNTREDCSMIYANAMVLFPDPNAPMVEYETIQDIISCVLLFNFGLSLHLTSVYSPTSFDHKEQCMGQAVMSYEMALTDFDCWNLRYDHEGDYQRENAPWLVTLKYLELCLLNNSSYCYAHSQRIMGSDDEMHDVYLERMSLVLEEVMNGARPDQYPSSLLFFARNIRQNLRIVEQMAPAA
mmetsp:Transcript_1246/g.2737  ORF Transcript_1246/g.2737 Transcript_1246/m.2737 type:complete len:246 (+) Transcript_1246:336-1073(+)